MTGPDSTPEPEVSERCDYCRMKIDDHGSLIVDSERRLICPRITMAFGDA